MTKKTRTILFLIFLFLFLLISPIAILYSQGYRFDFENKKITQTGGLFLKVWPRQVEIFIDGKLVKKTDFFFGSSLIENLLPKKYKIRLEKEGYFPWEKNLEVREKEVTEVKNIVLFPKDLNFKTLAKDIAPHQSSGGGWFSPDNKKIILYEKTETGWALKLYDLEKNIKSHLISETDIYTKGADLMNLEFSQDSKEIYLAVAMKEQEKYFTLRLDKSPPQLNERKVVPPSENVIASQKINNDFFYLDYNPPTALGNLFKNEVRFTEKPFPIQAETEYQLEIFQNFIFLSEEQTFYLLNPELKFFEKFFEGINVLKISPENKKLAFSSDFEIWLFFLSDQPTKKTGEKLFINRLSEKIGNIFWLNSDYLIFNSGDNLKIVEIDERDRIQTWDVGNFPEPRKLYFNFSNKKLYILSEGNLFASERLY